MGNDRIHQQPADWAAAHGGLRGSTSLAAGSLLLAAGALVNFGEQLAGGGTEREAGAVLMLGWLAWILGLGVAGWGLAWIGAGPVLSRLGFGVGVAHAAHAVVLVVALSAAAELPVPIAAFAFARLVLLAFFARWEAPWLGRRTAWFLGSACTLQAAKIVLRVTGAVPDLAVPAGPLLDATLNLAVAVAVFQAARRVRLAEDQWARASFAAPVAGFEQFDNPDHVHLDRP